MAATSSIELFCQCGEPGLLLLARQTDQAFECFLFFLASVFGPLVDLLLFAFLFALLALLLAPNLEFLGVGLRSLPPVPFSRCP